MTISGTSASQTITGLNGILAGPNGANNFTIDGVNLLNTATGFAGNVAGTYNAITVTGLQNYSITGLPAAGNVLSFDGTSFIYANVGQQIPTLTGINGLTVAGTGLSQSIIGQNFFGANGVTVSVNGTNVTITGTSSPFTSTLAGTSYTTDNILIGVTTPAGAGNKLKVAGGDLSAQ